MTNNPYQPFFDQLDRAVADLERESDTTPCTTTPAEQADLLKRAGFVLANLLNVQAQVYPTLFLEPETVEGEASDTDSTSLE